MFYLFTIDQDHPSPKKKKKGQKGKIVVRGGPTNS